MGREEVTPSVRKLIMSSKKGAYFSLSTNRGVRPRSLPTDSLGDLFHSTLPRGGGTGRGGLSAAMAPRGVVGIFLLSALPFLCLELRRGSPDLGIKDIILLCGRIFLLLALLTLIISVTTSWLNSFKSSQVYLKEEEEKNEKKQKLVREKQQETQSEKVSKYIENVLKPHQEMKLRKLEERFYQTTGETWKLSNGHKLGGDEYLVLESENQTSFATPSREAAQRRNLPTSSTRASPPADQPPQKVPDLPEEPPETAEEVVTVALRCPQGSVLRRRFSKSCSSQVLFDWMMKIGYHTSLYSLSTSFPRRPLRAEGGRSLQDVGITVDTVLNVEEKERSN
ncbi:UBX domain-containing protein 8 isoform X1 [Saccopteryx bilineata]|uniref:UBX domain-containing protein 8 isoform X1 n=1 Tax=Saccopteryx bilineata TaxID=59482 RepID=UPI00338F2D52